MIFSCGSQLPLIINLSEKAVHRERNPSTRHIAHSDKSINLNRQYFYLTLNPATSRHRPHSNRCDSYHKNIPSILLELHCWPLDTSHGWKKKCSLFETGIKGRNYYLLIILRMFYKIVYITFFYMLKNYVLRISNIWKYIFSQQLYNESKKSQKIKRINNIQLIKLHFIWT